MWKTAFTTQRRQWDVGDGFSALCPSCDSLGPHPVETQEMGWWDAAVHCIDCGEALGYLGWHGLYKFAADAAEEAGGPGLERLRAHSILQDVLLSAQPEPRRRAR